MGVPVERCAYKGLRRARSLLGVEVLVRDRAALEEERDEGRDDYDQPLDVNIHLGAPRIPKPPSLGKAMTER